MGLVYNPIHNRKDNMKAEIIARLLMVLTGFVLAMLGIITFVHSDHHTLGILISFAGVMSMFGGLPSYE